MSSEATTKKEVSQSVLESQISAEPSHPETGGRVPSHKVAYDLGYPARKYVKPEKVEAAKEDVGAARRAIDKQIPETARPALSKKEYDAKKYEEHQ